MWQVSPPLPRTGCQTVWLMKTENSWYNKTEPKFWWSPFLALLQTVLALFKWFPKRQGWLCVHTGYISSYDQKGQGQMHFCMPVQTTRISVRSPATENQTQLPFGLKCNTSMVWDPETSMQLQVAYFRGDLGNTLGGMRLWNKKRKEANKVIFTTENQNFSILLEDSGRR